MAGASEKKRTAAGDAARNSAARGVGQVARDSAALSRRDFLGAGALTLGGLVLGDLLSSRLLGQAVPGSAAGTAATAAPSAAAAVTTAASAVSQPAALAPLAVPKAKSVILLWMGGGPPHLDTFDPKPEAGEPYCGQFRKPIETKVPGLFIGEMLPLLAAQADKFSILRGMTHGNNGHETATYIMQTCTMPSPDLCYPALGAVVAYKMQTERGYAGSLPPFITLTNGLGRFSEAGFLGSNYQTFATGGDPAAKEFLVQGLVLPRSQTPQRMAERRAMLEAVDGYGAARKDEATLAAMAEYQRKAYELMLGEAREVFDLSTEKNELRDKYGRHRFGQSCLTARRLVERGVPFVTVNYGGWDTHKEHFPAMRRLLPPLDAGFAALLDDLAQRGLLDSTIVIWMGEFGRAPLVSKEPPWNGGRQHYGAVFSAVVAGGGFKGGQVVGSSDAKGEKVKDRPIYPWDLAATVYHQLGIDPQGRLPHPQGCVARVMPKLAADAKSGGPLTEII